MKRIISYLLILITLGLYAQPKGSCNIGTISLGSDGKLYGCVEEKWRGLSEQEPSTGIAISAENGEIKRIGNTLYAKENGKIYDIKNIGFTPINISGEQHEIGKIIYSNTLKHFYVGIENNKWWQIDNDFQLFGKAFLVVDPVPNAMLQVNFYIFFSHSTGDLYKVPNDKKVKLYNCEYCKKGDICNPYPSFGKGYLIKQTDNNGTPILVGEDNIYVGYFGKYDLDEPTLKGYFTCDWGYR